nr:hypothetical protein [Mycoplasmopsis bovis]
MLLLFFHHLVKSAEIMQYPKAPIDIVPSIAIFTVPDLSANIPAIAS